jgi:hypothetical protein
MLKSCFGVYVISPDCIRISKPISPLARGFAIVCAQQVGLDEVSRVGRRIARRYSDGPEVLRRHVDGLRISTGLREISRTGILC